VQVEHEVVIWAGERTREIIGGSDLGGHAPVTLVNSEEEFWAHMPPRGNAKLYLIDSDCCAHATPGFIAALAARPATWPPFVTYGLDLTLVKASPIEPNSRICEPPERLVGALTAAASYWVLQNAPMALE